MAPNVVYALLDWEMVMTGYSINRFVDRGANHAR